MDLSSSFRTVSRSLTIFWLSYWPLPTFYSLLTPTHQIKAQKLVFNFLHFSSRGSVRASDKCRAFAHPIWNRKLNIGIKKHKTSMFYHSSAYFLIFINVNDKFFTQKVFCDFYTSCAERKDGYEAQRKYQHLRTSTEKFMTVI